MKHHAIVSTRGLSQNVDFVSFRDFLLRVLWAHRVALLLQTALTEAYSSPKLEAIQSIVHP